MFTNAVLAGRYQLLRIIGMGGMSEVWLGNDARLDRKIAVKILKLDLLEDGTTFRRFQKEALNAASLNHPNIVAVFDSGEAKIDGNVVPFIVMEYVPGRTLRDYIHAEDEADSGLISEKTKLQWIAEACLALEYSHQHHIIHRDIKPANIMVNDDGLVKVMDFGIARAISDSSHTMTQTSAVVGTAQYLSPEQAKGETITPLSDIYSLGCVLFEILTKKPPFSGDSLVSVAYQHVRENPLPPSSINPEISPAVDAVVLKALNKNPINRYQSAAEMRNDLLKLLRGEEPAAPKILADNYNNTLLDTEVASRKLFRDTATKVLNKGNGETWNKVRANVVDNKKIGILLAGLLLLLMVFLVGNKLIPNLLSKNDTITVAEVAGLPKDKASEVLVNQGFKVIVKVIPDNVIPEGKAIGSEPTSGTSVAASTVITLKVSSGPAKLQVPNLIGKSRTEVVDTLKRLGFTVDEHIAERPSVPKFKDKLVSTDPKLGATVASNTPIRLTFGTGITGNTIPAVVGSDLASATKRLTDLGFKVEVEQIDSTKPLDTVLQMQPKAGEAIPADGKITLFVSKNNLFVMPNVADRAQTVAMAKANLARAGFTGKVTVRERQVSLLEFPLNGKILEQSVTAGEVIDKNSEITLYVGVM